MDYLENERLMFDPSENEREGSPIWCIFINEELHDYGEGFTAMNSKYQQLVNDTDKVEFGSVQDYELEHYGKDCYGYFKEW